MYVKLSKLICFMDGYSQAFLNIATGNCFYKKDTEKDIQADSGLSIPIPIVDLTEIKQQYISSISNPKIKRIFNGIDSNNFHSIFHKLTVEYDLEEEWWNFEKKSLKDIAIRWCNENNIQYSVK